MIRQFLIHFSRIRLDEALEISPNQFTDLAAFGRINPKQKSHGRIRHMSNNARKRLPPTETKKTLSDTRRPHS